MAKSISVVPKKRGRPATGRDPATSVRLSQTLLERLDRWISEQSAPLPTRSEAIRRILDQTLLQTLDDQIAANARKIARTIPNERSPARGMAQMRKGLAESDHRKLVAKKAAKPEPASKGKPTASSGKKGNDAKDGNLTRRALVAGRSKKKP